MGTGGRAAGDRILARRRRSGRSRCPSCAPVARRIAADLRSGHRPGGAMWLSDADLRGSGRRLPRRDRRGQRPRPPWGGADQRRPARRRRLRRAAGPAASRPVDAKHPHAAGGQPIRPDRHPGRHAGHGRTRHRRHPRPAGKRRRLDQQPRGRRRDPVHAPRHPVEPVQPAGGPARRHRVPPDLGGGATRHDQRRSRGAGPLALGSAIDQHRGGDPVPGGRRAGGLQHRRHRRGRGRFGRARPGGARRPSGRRYGAGVRGPCRRA